MLLERINKRASESENTRNDDNYRILKNRVKVYKNDTMPVIEYYRVLNKLNTINGMQDVEEVFQEIIEIL